MAVTCRGCAKSSLFWKVLCHSDSHYSSIMDKYRPLWNYPQLFKIFKHFTAHCFGLVSCHCAVLVLPHSHYGLLHNFQSQQASVFRIKRMNPLHTTCQAPAAGDKRVHMNTNTDNFFFFCWISILPYFTCNFNKVIIKECKFFLLNTKGPTYVITLTCQSLKSQ